MDLRVGLEQVAAWLHNYDVQHQEGHRNRVLAAKQRFQRLQYLATAPEIDDERRFGLLFSYVRKIEPMIFEELVLIAFKANGYMIRGNEAYTGDGGIDGRVWIDDWLEVDPGFAKRYPNRIVRGWAGIQCKRYAGAVRREHLQQFPHDLAKADLVAGFFVHTGTTPKSRPGAGTQPKRNDEEQNWLPPVRRVSGGVLLHLLTAGKFPPR